MNKLLPILLVVVLSGCGGNAKIPLENCADNQAVFPTSYGMRPLWKHRTFMKSLGFYEKCILKRKHAECKQHLNEFLTKPLSEKLSFSAYEYRFQICEDIKSDYPETFESKWK